MSCRQIFVQVIPIDCNSKSSSFSFSRYSPICYTSISVFKIQRTIRTNRRSSSSICKSHTVNKDLGFRIKISTGSNLINSSNNSQADTSQCVLEEELDLLVLGRLNEVNERHSLINMNVGVVNGSIVQTTCRSNTPNKVNTIFGHRAHSVLNPRICIIYCICHHFIDTYSCAGGGISC